MASTSRRNPPPPDAALVVGLDFGTTFTGVEWAHTSDSKPYTIDNWPAGLDGIAGIKVPTKLMYTANQEVPWGYTAEEGSGQVLSLFKLALEPQMYDDAVRALGATLHYPNLDQMITDYLTGVFRHVMLTIRQSIGTAMVDQSRTHVVVTVPAIWTERSRQRTLQAVKNIPGLPQPFTASLCLEPEAAALSTLQQFRDLDNREVLDIGDTFVVVDAGGGTVDLVTYTVTALSPTLEVQEAAEGTGSVCGAALVNLRFEHFLKSKLGNQAGWDDETLREAMRTFETRVKRAFTAEDVATNRTYNIPVPGLRLNQDIDVTRNGRFSLKAADVHMCFEPDILEIIRLVKEQIAMSKTTIHSIILVGGYGQSNYLRQRLSLVFEKGANTQVSIPILQPRKAWIAVANGAAMRALYEVRPEGSGPNAIVRSRRARKHYGIELGVEFIPTTHAGISDRKYWDSYSGVWRVQAMTWLLTRGQQVSENASSREEFCNTWPVSTQKLRKFTLDVFCDNTSTTAPIERSPNVELLCRLTADLSAIPDERLEKKQGADGNMHYVVEFEIESVYQAAQTTYALIYKDQRYDAVTAEYVF
ncbi:hypothetical protein F5Y18DRAFT_420208 [Xylariaceae sp. FL1019]|nr:hypothetical protein F5Y18DRAFT_420208 [Xylariaceae sp. FL1019]